MKIPLEQRSSYLVVGHSKTKTVNTFQDKLVKFVHIARKHHNPATHVRLVADETTSICFGRRAMCNQGSLSRKLGSLVLLLVMRLYICCTCFLLYKYHVYRLSKVCNGLCQLHLMCMQARACCCPLVCCLFPAIPFYHAPGTAYPILRLLTACYTQSSSVNFSWDAQWNSSGRNSV